MPPEPKSYLQACLFARRMKTSDLANLIGVPRQTIHKFVIGKAINRDWAVKMAPHLGIAWPDLVERQARKQLTADIEEGVAVGQSVPRRVEAVDDPDKLALLDFWDSLSIVKRAALFAHLGIEDMPSLRRKSQ